MDLWQLKIFCKVVELKSFSKAGQAVYLSQPTVSSHIKDLENHLGAHLVDRLARQVVPTKAGELLYRYAQRLIALRDEAEGAMADFLGKLKGRLTIGGSTIPGVYVLPRLIGDFTPKFPEVRVALIVGDTSDILDKLSTGAIEIGIVGGVSDDDQLHQIPLFDDELRVVVPQQHPWARKSSISVAELLNAPFIAREKGSGTLSSFQQSLLKHGHELNDVHIVAEMGSTEAVRQGIKSNVGISILSALAVADDVRAGTLHTLGIKGIDLKRTFFLTRPKQRTASPLCRVFWQFLQSQYSHLVDHEPDGKF